MKDYELTVVFHPDLEMNLDPALDKVRKAIESNKGVIIKEEPDGKKRLSYKIKGQEFGVYHYFDVQLPPEAPAKISSIYNITDEIIRCLLVKADPRKAKLAVLRQEEATEEAKEESVGETKETNSDTESEEKGE